MSAFITLDSLSARTADGRTLFTDLTLAIGAERVGLVGRNGSGKSTLIRIIAGDIEPAAGSVRSSGTIGILDQEWPERLTVAEALGVAEPLALLERVIAGGGRPQDFDDADWGLDARVATALAEVGLPELPLDRGLGTLSGGERTRIGIARLLIAAPDLLLLDEPTNNLDAAGRAAIQSLVRSWRGGLLVASHDRRLLEDMDVIVELTPIGIRMVRGGWSAFAATRAAERAAATTEAQRAEIALRETRRATQRQHEAQERRDGAGRRSARGGGVPKLALGARAERAENTGGRAAQTGNRQLEAATTRLDAARSKVEVLTPIAMALPASGLMARTELLRLDAVTIERDNRCFGPWTLSLQGPERVAITGPNGAGKTTLLKLAAGLLAPSGGQLRRAEGRIAMLDQHVALLDPAASIIDNFQRLHPALTAEDAHAACARFAFRNRDAQRIVSGLSGGERLRAGLACTLAGAWPPWLLLLDEPTNHLDIPSVELLEEALRDFDGALMVVSHDADFLAAIGIERSFPVDAER